MDIQQIFLSVILPLSIIILAVGVYFYIKFNRDKKESQMIDSLIKTERIHGSSNKVKQPEEEKFEEIQPKVKYTPKKLSQPQKPETKKKPIPRKNMQTMPAKKPSPIQSLNTIAKSTKEQPKKSALDKLRSLSKK